MKKTNETKEEFLKRKTGSKNFQIINKTRGEDISKPVGKEIITTVKEPIKIIPKEQS